MPRVEIDLHDLAPETSRSRQLGAVTVHQVHEMTLAASPVAEMSDHDRRRVSRSSIGHGTIL